MTATPVIVHFGEYSDAGLITAEDPAFEVSRARGNTFEPAVYIVAENSGTWSLVSQKDNPAEPVWYEIVEPTDEHRALATKYDEEIA